MGDENSREPWSFGKDACDIFRKFARFRYCLLPYIVSQAKKCSDTGLPIVRAMILEYPEDRNVYFIEDQYMFGDEMLVAPVIAPITEQPIRHLYLPKGQWVDFWDGQIYNSEGQWIDMEVILDTMPLFVKSTAIIPYGEERQSTENVIGNIRGLEIYPAAQGEWNYDDGENKITVKISSNNIEIDRWNGQGTLNLYCVKERSTTVFEKDIVKLSSRELV